MIERLANDHLKRGLRLVVVQSSRAFAYNKLVSITTIPRPVAEVVRIDGSPAMLHFMAVAHKFDPTTGQRVPAANAIALVAAEADVETWNVEFDGDIMRIVQP